MSHSARFNPTVQAFARRARPALPHGFTLIELLVVISIIGLLVAILMPALSSARTAAHMSASLSNMHQITVALHGYAGDNKDSMPFLQRAYWNVNIWAPQQSLHKSFWGGQLWSSKYVTSARVFWGPGRNLQNIDPNNLASPGGFSNFRFTGYAANTGALGQGESALLNYRDGLTGGTINGMPLRLSESNAPTHGNFLLLAEGASEASIPISMDGWHRGTPATYSSTSTVRLLPWNYNGSLCRSYVDGHAFAGGRVTSGYIGTGYAPAETNDMGFDPGIDGPYPGGLSGKWQYLNAITDFWPRKPWYLQWRSEGWVR
jgi:prepilin-type N-terminal cleavage/methylation domain-containing protein